LYDVNLRKKPGQNKTYFKKFLNLSLILLKNNIPKKITKNNEKYLQMILNGKISLNITVQNPTKKKTISINKL
jgi:hypothetical protein